MKHLFLYFMTFMQKYPLGYDRESASESNLIQWYEKQGLYEPWGHLIVTGSCILFASVRKSFLWDKYWKNS